MTVAPLALAVATVAATSGTDKSEIQRAPLAWTGSFGVTIAPKYGLNLTQMFDSMEHGDLRALYVREALRMFQSSPIVGVGPGGWAAEPA